ncbi:unnamed protein product, partial [Phaeothamnion confervicola]
MRIHREYAARKKPLLEARQEAIKALPRFWFKVLIAHELSGLFIADQDQAVLAFLTGISVVDIEGEEESPAVLRITFTFSENPFFTDSELWKEW